MALEAMCTKEPRIEIPVHGIGILRGVRNPTVIDRILEAMPTNYVLCEFLNRTVGGVTYAILSAEAAQERHKQDHKQWASTDEKLMAIYTREQLEEKKRLLSK